MRLTSTLAAIFVAATVPLCATPAAAAPLSQSLALNNTGLNADISNVEHVQYRRWGRGWNGGRWIGPAVGLAAGAIVGSAIASSAYDDGYYAYGAVPRYGYAAPGYYAYGAFSGNYGINFPPQYGSCTGDRDEDSSYPSWACR